MKKLFTFAVILGLLCIAHAWGNDNQNNQGSHGDQSGQGHQWNNQDHENNQWNNQDHEDNNGKTRVRFAHQCPDAPKVDVYVNGDRVWEAIEFRTVTEYIEFAGDKADIEVTVARTRVVVISRRVELNQTAISVCAINRLLELNVAVYEDYNQDQPEQGKSAVRAIHQSPDAPAVDVYGEVGQDEVLLFSGLKYKEATQYAQVDSRCYKILVRVAGTRQTVLKIDNVCVESQKAYSVFVNGLVDTVLPRRGLGQSIAQDN